MTTTRAALVLAALLAAGPATAGAPNMEGSGVMVVSAPAGRKPTLSLRYSAIAYKSAIYATGYETVVLSHYYYPLSQQKVAQLVAGLETWLAAPHSVSVFSTYVPGSGASASFTGSAWNAQVPPVISCRLGLWTPGQEPHHHGEVFVVLEVDQIEALLAVLRAWLEKPWSQEAPIYQHVVY